MAGNQQTFMKRLLLLPLSCLALAFQVHDASAQGSDNFNDGDDVGWTQYNPIVGSAYSFPASTQGGLGYKMTAPSGNGRVGSFMTSMQAFPDGTVSVDLIDFTLATRQ